MSFRNFFLIGLSAVIIILNSCMEKKEKNDTPQNVLNQEMTAEIMARTHLAEAFLQQNNTLPPDKRKTETPDIFAEMKISRENYENSIKYYSQRPLELKQIHELAMEKINRWKKEKTKN